MIKINHRFVAEQFINGRWRARAESDDRELLADMVAGAVGEFRIIDTKEEPAHGWQICGK